MVSQHCRGGTVGVPPFADGSTAKKAALSCQFILDHFDGLEDGDIRFIANKAKKSGVDKMVCTIDGKTATQKSAQCCESKDDPGESCATALAENDQMESGVWWMERKQSGEGAMQVWCDMTTNGGGWYGIRVYMSMLEDAMRVLRWMARILKERTSNMSMLLPLPFFPTTEGPWR
jgi:hypothetical protein